jgi:hypothetical protein
VNKYFTTYVFLDYIRGTGLFFCMTKIMKFEDFECPPAKNAGLNFIEILA